MCSMNNEKEEAAPCSGGSFESLSSRHTLKSKRKEGKGIVMNFRQVGKGRPIPR